jgi:hypothetical protein
MFRENPRLLRTARAVCHHWWAYEEGWPETSRNGVYSSSRVLSIAGGVLDVSIHTEGGAHPVAAPICRMIRKF